MIASLQRAGVRRLFTLSGNHIMCLFDAALDARIELIHVRHEAAAVHMADAWARLTGEVGVALVTGGPGHANAVSALYTASMAESPVLLLSGHAPRSQLGLGAFQEMRQAAIAAPLCKAAWTSESADAVADDLAKAWRIAREGRPGPVHLSLPIDVLEGTVSLPPAGLGGDIFAPDAAALSTAAARRIRERLGKAVRPLVLTGPMTLTRRGRERSRALEASLGIPVVGMESPRGMADPALGAFAEVAARADVVLLLGKKLDFSLKFGQSPAFATTCEFMLIDPNNDQVQRTQRVLASRLVDAFVADTFPAMQALMDVTTVPVSANRGWLEDVREAVAWRPAAWASLDATEGRLHPVQALRPLQAILDGHPDSVLVSDGGEFGQWAQACLTAPHRLINGPAGSIGSALPFALSARLAQAHAPVVAVLGDGTFGFHCAEIDTALRHALPFLAVVGNDARWNAEYQIQLRDYGRERTLGCELLPSRYDQVCASFGGYGECVRSADELLPAARRAIASDLPACLNVMIEGLPAPDIKRP